MEFPPEWVIMPREDFEIAAPRDPGSLGMELLAQIRPSGRVMDHFRIVLGGFSRVEAVFTGKSLFTNNSFPNVRLNYQLWPRDIVFRRNMSTSEWLDLAGLIASNDVLAYRPSEAAGSSQDAEDEELCNSDVTAFLAGLTDRSQCGASVRWAIGIGPDGRMELALQGLPAAAAILNGKPTLRG